MASNPPAPRIQDSFSEEGFLRAVVDTIVDAIVTIDARGIILQANPAALKIFGYTRGELVGNNVSMLMPATIGREHDGYLEAFLKTRVAKIIGIGRQVTAVRKDGSEFPIELAVSEVSIEGNTYFTGIMRDISEKVRVEEAVRQERDFSRSLIDTAHAIILVLDPLGRIERFNPYLEELTGYAIDEVVGKDWFEIFIPEAERSDIRDLFAKTLSGIPVVSNVNAILTKSGKERVVAWSGRRLLNLAGDVIGVLAIGNDITELKAAERRLVQSERLAAVGQMVTGLAHESRNALQRTLASLEMLEMDAGDDPDALELIQRAKRAMSELQRLYDEVRNYAAPIKLDRSTFSLTHLLEETWEQVQQVHETQRVSFDVRVQSDLDTIEADRDRLQQVFRNVIENALAVSPSEGLIRVASAKCELNGQPAVRITITDDGPGLSDDQQRRIFEPFYTTKTRGTGLGMAIAARIINAHNGVLTATNHESLGAELSVAIPSRLRS
ncbi:MAG: PAS domain S-box protein [Planctomycetaceae bacterium]|nr:PAS domain S-box protein [Planctomycetaceae bacterium]MCB9952935.1 PAS domain S-box protein [Planctomycetaceae bacterium]